MSFFQRLSHDERGATAIEYGLIAALIAIGLVTALGALGGELNETFVNVEADLDNANSGASQPAAD